MKTHSRDVLFVDGVLGYTQCPNTAMSILELIQERLVVLVEVLMNDDLGFLVPFCHLDWSSAKDRYATDALLRKHVVEDGCANKARCASEDKMHDCCDCVS